MSRRPRAPAGTWPAGLLVLGLVAVLAGLAWLLWPAGTPTPSRPAPATVLEPASCGMPGVGDVVRVDVAGRRVRAELDGCGHRAGAQLTVEVPGAVHDGMTVRLAGTGTPAGATTAQRLAAVLLALAGGAGAVLGWRLGHAPARRPSPSTPHGYMAGSGPGSASISP